MTAEDNCGNRQLDELKADKKEMRCIWKYKEFDCDKWISVAGDFLLFYFKEYVRRKKWWK